MLIAFEGGEATGKSTQARLLAERLDAVLTREPGATALGARLRALLLDPDGEFGAVAVGHRAEALLMAADRAQHIEEVIAPALAAHRHVVTDRYLYSTLAYQGFGRGLVLDELRSLAHFAAAPEADVVVLLTVSSVLAARRLASTGRLDRIEAAGVDLHERVTAGFDALAAADPDRWVVVDGEGTVEEVAERVWAAVSARLHP